MSAAAEEIPGIRVSVEVGTSDIPTPLDEVSGADITDPAEPWISVRLSNPGNAAVEASRTPSAPLLNFTHAAPTSSTTMFS